MTTTEPARVPEPDQDQDALKKQQYLESLIEQWNTQRQNWVLQAISNCVLGEAEGFQKNVFRHLIKRMLDPTRVDFSNQIDSLLMLGSWKHGHVKYPKQFRKHKGRAWWSITFPFFQLVGRGNRPRTILHSEWSTHKRSK